MLPATLPAMLLAVLPATLPAMLPACWCCRGLMGRVQGAAFALAWASQALAKENTTVQGWGQEGEIVF